MTGSVSAVRERRLLLSFHRFTRRGETPHCTATGWSYPSIVLAPATRVKIETWINEAPEFRKVETEPLANDAWETRAIEDGQVVFEEVDVETDEPVLNRLAAWCELHTKTSAKPPVKATGAFESAPQRRVGQSRV